MAKAFTKTVTAPAVVAPVAAAAPVAKKTPTPVVKAKPDAKAVLTAVAQGKMTATQAIAAVAPIETPAVATPAPKAKTPEVVAPVVPVMTPAPSVAATTPAKKGFASISRKDGLRAPQVRILAALAKSGKAMTRKELAEKAPVDTAMCTEYLGSNDEEKRKTNDTKHFPSLISKGFVKFDTTAEGATAYSITAEGKKAAASKD